MLNEDELLQVENYLSSKGIQCGNTDDTPLDTSRVLAINGNAGSYYTIAKLKENAKDTFQTLANKVTAFQATPDDTHYPSEKLVKKSLDGKSDSGHTHDDRYYTESEIDSKVSALNTSISNEATARGNADALKLNTADLLNKVYPVGSIYMSLNSVSPASFIGGTWSMLPAGYALWTATSGLSLTSDDDNKISAGLPNIKGRLWKNNTNTFFIHASSTTIESAGALGVERWASTAYGQCTGSSTLVHGIYFRADYGEIHGDTYSNLVYGKSDTVQPPAYKIYAWKRTA